MLFVRPHTYNNIYSDPAEQGVRLSPSALTDGREERLVSIRELSFLKRQLPPIPKRKGCVEKKYSNTALLLLVCDPGEARTHDPMIKSHLLYQLSYGVSTHQKARPSDFDAAKVCFFCYAPNESAKKFLHTPSGIDCHDTASLM